MLGGIVMIDMDQTLHAFRDIARNAWDLPSIGGLIASLRGRRCG